MCIRDSSYLSRIYKQQTGMNLMSYVSTMRIRRACELLAQTSMKVGQIAIELSLIHIYPQYRANFPSVFAENSQASLR